MLRRDSIPKRMSNDKQINTDGRKFLDFCDYNNLVILNGLFGVESGKYTHINCNGVSVIDYVACSPALLEHITDFSVHSRAEGNHMPLSMSLNLRRSCAAPLIASHTGASKTITKYKWNCDMKDLFLSVIQDITYNFTRYAV
jgi:hypothetical protein